MSTAQQVTVATAAEEQRRLLFLEQLGGDTALYNVHFGFRWYGEVDVDALDVALDAVVARHEVLRTTFRSVGGVPKQVIAEHVAVPLRLTSRCVTPSARHDDALRLAAVHAREPFDLAAGPLLRAELVSFTDADHAFLLTLHHTVFDGWSAGVLFDELSEAYTAYARGSTPDWAPLPLQYADFAEWQAEQLASGVWDEQAEHWAGCLEGAPAVVDLPTDRPRPAAQSFRGELVELALPDTVEVALTDVCRRLRCTRFTALLAAFAVLLRSLTRSDDLVIGTVVAGRGKVELERLIGLFSNTVALRVPVAGTETFAELLATVRTIVADAQSHADLPFAELVRRVRPARAHSHNPVFQVMFDVQPGGADRLRLPGVRAEALRVRDRGVSLFDLSVSVETDASGSRLVAEYATELFERDTVTALLETYRTMLADLLSAPDRPVGAAATVTPDQRAALLAVADRTREAGRAPSVTDLIAANLRDRGAATAVVAEDGTVVSYADLDRWAGAVARALRAAGVRPGDVVGLYAARSAEAVAGILGVLRAGAGYLPLDPDQPPARTAAILAAAGPVAVLATEESFAGLDTGTAARVALPPSPAAAEPDAAAEPWHPGDPADLAYVLFTSGSTGSPKGVMVTRGGLANYVSADLATYRLSPADRVLMFTALTFDVSAEELFPALAAGAVLVLRTGPMLETAADFFAECDRLGVTVCHLPTAWFHQLAAELGTGARPPAALRAMAIGGEAPGVPQVRAWRDAVPDMLLTNVYGPTETTIVATIATLVGAGRPADPDRIPLGRPIAGTSCYLLDDRMEPVAPGAVGELYLGGAGLARGYLADPVRTAGAFVPHPFEVGERLYRTGDRARLGVDGEVEFRGRTDHQVKVRGYRVEPGEVEVALLGLPGVAAAAVTVHEDRSSLVAYVVPAAGVPLPAEDELLAALGARLPAYLVPSVVVPLAELPLTAHHKIDKSALPAPPERSASAEPPTGHTERAVAAVWQDVLGVAGIGRRDDFFTLGGHSLLATRVISGLRAEFGAAVRMSLLFERPVLADFAAGLAGAGTAVRARPALVPRTAGELSRTALSAGMTATEIEALLGASDGSTGRRQV